jgi:TonB family protein
MAEINAQWMKDHPQGDDPAPEEIGHPAPPRLPQEALDAGVQHEIYIVQANVDEHGQVTHVKLLQTSPPPAYLIDEAVIAYVKQYKFRPAVKAGKPIAASVSLEIDLH